MTIGELSERAGLSVPAIRFYERCGIFGEEGVRRRENNYREYGEEALEILTLVRGAQAAGFTLAEIGSFLSAFKSGSMAEPEVARLLEEKLRQVDRKREELEAVREVIAGKLSRYG